METLFIKKIINKELFNITPSIILDGLFCSSIDKELVFTKNDNNDEYEFIINIDNIDTTNLTNDEENDTNIYIKMVNEEYNKITNNIKYLIANIDLKKLIIQDYKVNDYSDTPNYLKKKIKTHIYDAKKFIIKNNIDKNKINNTISQITNNEIQPTEINEIKLILYFVLIKFIDLYNCYNKSILYSLELLREYPYLIRYKDDYLVSINPAFFTITNDEITIMHLNTINNAYAKTSNANINSSKINISKNKIKFI
jgi:hypothetical protein